MSEGGGGGIFVGECSGEVGGVVVGVCVSVVVRVGMYECSRGARDQGRGPDPILSVE